MAPPKPAPRSGKGLASRLQAKIGPLPVWAWAAVILGAYLLYSRMRPPAATTSPDTSTASTTDGTTGASQVPASGQGTAADNMSGQLFDMLGANTSAIDGLTASILSQPVPFSDFGDAPAAGTGSAPVGDTNPPAAQPTVAAPTTTTPQQLGANAGHATQTQAGSLKWGGLTFTTKRAFDQWAKSHGTTTARELNNHPQARGIYSSLA